MVGLLIVGADRPQVALRVGDGEPVILPTQASAELIANIRQVLRERT
ncbi:hypothetical protein [Amycolatopsis sp. H20-H5]|nr:hypothetical protein [Amycolatopsis sp. H20-H5]MEC3979427.1 hypothetical protein [Amycolatopsis sp. H20-H5]